MQTCVQKAVVLQGKAANGGRWKALGIGEVKALCKCLNMLPFPAELLLCTALLTIVNCSD